MWFKILFFSALLALIAGSIYLSALNPPAPDGPIIVEIPRETLLPASAE